MEIYFGGGVKRICWSIGYGSEKEEESRVIFSLINTIRRKVENV